VRLGGRYDQAAAGPNYRQASQTQYEPECKGSGSALLSDNILHALQLHRTVLGAQDHATTCDIVPIVAGSTVGPI
jgi:hypothetical protein